MKASVEKLKEYSCRTSVALVQYWYSFMKVLFGAESYSLRAISACDHVYNQWPALNEISTPRSLFDSVYHHSTTLVTSCSHTCITWSLRWLSCVCLPAMPLASTWPQIRLAWNSPDNTLHRTRITVIILVSVHPSKFIFRRAGTINKRYVTAHLIRKLCWGLHFFPVMCLLSLIDVFSINVVFFICHRLP